ncbi:hypothetical protein ACFQYP_01715 [Nonomuraea antimicrobica]
MNEIQQIARVRDEDLAGQASGAGRGRCSPPSPPRSRSSRPRWSG